MAQWSDLPREVQFEIIKFAIAKIFRRHVNRTGGFRYWSQYDPPLDPSDDEEDIDDDSVYVPNVCGSNEFYDWIPNYVFEYSWTYKDGASYDDNPYKHSQLVSMLTISKAFLPPSDLEIILRQCGLVRLTDMQHLSQSESRYSLEERERFHTMWYRPSEVSLENPLRLEPRHACGLFQYMHYFPNLKLINLQMDQYLQADIDITRGYWSSRCYGWLENPEEIQQLPRNIYYRDPLHGTFGGLEDLLEQATILVSIIEIRITFQTKITDGDQEYSTKAMLSTRDFTMCFEHEGEEVSLHLFLYQAFFVDEMWKQGMGSHYYKRMPESLQNKIDGDLVELMKSQD